MEYLKRDLKRREPELLKALEFTTDLPKNKKQQQNPAAQLVPVPLPRNGSNFLDSVPQMRQLTSFWRIPPNIAVTTVDAPFLKKHHMGNSS